MSKFWLLLLCFCACCAGASSSRDRDSDNNGSDDDTIGSVSRRRNILGFGPSSSDADENKDVNANSFDQDDDQFFPSFPPNQQQQQQQDGQPGQGPPSGPDQEYELPPPPPPHSIASIAEISPVPLTESKNPYVQSVVPRNGPTDGGTVITITGYGFGEHSKNLDVTIGGSECKNLVLTMPTEILCETPSGAGSQLPLKITLFNKGHAHSNPPTDMPYFNYDLPVVLSVSPKNGPTSGETVVTITGRNFGIRDTKPLGKIGGRQCLDTTWISNDKLTCVAPKGAGLGDIRIFVEGQANPEGFGAIFQYDSPMVHQIVPDHGPTSGSTVITIWGANFGTTNNHPQVDIGGTSCETPHWYSDSAISCEVSGGLGGDKIVSVRVLGDHSSPNPAATFTFDGPIVTAISVSNGPTVGTTQVTMFGANFGHKEVAVVASVGGKACTASHWLSDSSIRCMVPSGLGTRNTLEVNIPGTQSQPSRMNLVYSYDAPRITSISPQRAPTTGHTGLTIYGENFGTHMSEILSHLGKTNCPQTQWVSNTAAICTIPAGTGADLQVRIMVKGQKSAPLNPDAIFAYSLPQITQLIPSEGKPDGGQLVTVVGSNFGTDKRLVTAKFGPAPATVLHVSDEKMVIATTPQQGSQPLVVTVNGQVSKSKIEFRFSGPHIYKLIQDHGPTVGGTTVTMVGSDLGTATGMSIQVGDMECLDSEWISMTSALCVTPPGVGGANALSVFRAGNLVAKSKVGAYFSYDVPVISEIEPSEGSSSGGTKILIMGRNFGFVDSAPTIRIGGTQCLESRWTSDAGAICFSPPATPGTATVPVTVEVGGQQSVKGAASFHYNAIPSKITISEINPMHSPPAGGTVVEIQGDGFEQPTEESVLAIRIGNTNCDVSTWVSASIVSCVISPGVGDNRAVVVEMGEEVVASSAPNNLFFSYDAPVVSSIHPSRGPMGGGIGLTVYGQNFGPDSNDVSSVTVGLTTCRSPNWVSQTMITCTAPAGEGIDQRVVVDVGHQQSHEEEFSNAASYSFEGLSIDQVTPDHVAATGNVMVTLHAASFGSKKAAEKGITVSFNDESCTDPVWLSPEEIRCKVGSGVGGEINVDIQIDKELWRGYGLFSYDAPVVSAVIPSEGPLFGGSAVTIYGNNFGVVDADPVAHIGQAECLSTLYVSNTEVTCMLPAYRGVGGDKDSYVWVEVKGQPSRYHVQPILFHFDPPIVTSVNPIRGPVVGRSTLTIHGKDFGISDTKPIAFIDGVACDSTQWISSSDIECVTPKGSDLYVPHFLYVRVLNRTSVLNPNANFSFADMSSWPSMADSSIFGSDVPSESQRQGSTFLTIAYLIPLFFILGSVVCGSCFLSSSSSAAPEHIGAHRRGLGGNYEGGGVVGKIKSGWTRLVYKVKRALFKSGGVYTAETNDRWADYNSLVESIEMDANSEMNGGLDDDQL